MIKMWAVVGLGMLVVPLLHLISGHSSPFHMRHGPTEHERRHAQRSRTVRIGATAAWLLWLALAAGLILQ